MPDASPCRMDVDHTEPYAPSARSPTLADTWVTDPCLPILLEAPFCPAKGFKGSTVFFFSFLIDEWRRCFCTKKERLAIIDA